MQVDVKCAKILVTLDSDEATQVASDLANTTSDISGHPMSTLMRCCKPRRTSTCRR